MEAVPEIVALRLSHLKAQTAAQQGALHLAVQQYLVCLERAERRQDPACMAYFAERLCECYTRMGLPDKAKAYKELAR
ncbi:hypothetical protein HNR42_001658 [Deinobacterium chartae]|uniref:Uncharacterized protein n=1 Tax=Deinobacterium chartae TaxID=521158 RepID=A0A841HZ76_9DEIO|nr:hypothetical protein [Deinobacterium chartae]MBB6098233.1 hypothetical protein [Deinobacterium chartae]